jgi:hypothetical protein
MRRRRQAVAIAVVLAFACGAGAAPKPSAGALVESSAFTWSPGRSPYDLRIEGRPDIDAGHPVLRIVGPGGERLVVKAGGGLVPYAEGLLDPIASHSGQAVKSRYVYANAALRDRQGQPMVAVFGYAFASDPGAVRVIGLDGAGRPRVLLRQETFALAEVRDLDGDGVAELIGRRRLSQTSGECRTTYDPFAVYRLDAGPAARFRYSEGLSRRYNLAHYVWAGPAAHEDIAVASCGKQPRILPVRP